VARSDARSSQPAGRAAPPPARRARSSPVTPAHAPANLAGSGRFARDRAAASEILRRERRAWN
jgi:hypothetical protein